MERIYTMMKTRYLVEASTIAALYAALTILIMPFASGQLQVRISEALTILPFFTPAAIPGLFVGCILANIVTGAGIYDVILGSLATLLAAYITYKMPKKFLAPLPPVIINAVVVAIILKISFNLPILPSMGFVALGETIACYVLGYPLLLLVDRHKQRIFH
jgi:Predicted membrane protein